MARRPDQRSGPRRTRRDDRRHDAPPPMRQPRPRPDDDLVRVAGLPSVAELFETAHERVERLYFEAALKADVQPYCSALARRRKVYRQVGDDEMRRVAGTAMHGGVVALARPRPVRPMEASLGRTWAAAGRPMIVLDGVGNPQNIGAIARTAAFFGIRHIVLSDHPGQSGVSDASYRIAKGGLEHVDLYRATHLSELLRALADSYHIVGTAMRGKPLKSFAKGGKPIALVLGNEEDGLPPATLAACASVVTLAGAGRVQSLNVSAAAAVLIHALLVER